MLVVQLASACGSSSPPTPPPTQSADTTAPTTRATPVGGSFAGSVTVTLQCDDGASGSGCAATYYTLDGAAPTTSSLRYGSALKLSSETTVRFFSVDVAGNAEAAKSEHYTFAVSPSDTTAPTVSASPVGGLYRTAQSVTLTCTDAGSGCAAIHYTTDGSTPTQSSPTYTAPLAVTQSTALRFFAVDVAGNASAVASEDYTLDGAAPTTEATPAGGTFAGDTAVTLACTDGAGSGCNATYYTLDGSTPTRDSTPYTAAVVVAQSATLKFFSVDKAGNAEAVRTESYLIDGAAPTTTASPAGGTYAAAKSVTLACTDGEGGSGCAATYYTVDGSAPTTASTRYTGAIEVSVDTTVKYFSVDAAGNAETVHTQTYVIDADAPSTTASPASGSYTGTQSVALTCSDGAGSGCSATHYTLDGSTPTSDSPLYASPLSLTGNVTLKFFSVDLAGNAEAVRTETYVIVPSPAEVSARIAKIRALADGPISEDVERAVVTFTKVLTGTAASDPAGFFLQAEQSGPAVFVAVDPATLSPAPTVGDTVSFHATAKATVGSQPRIAALDAASFTVVSSGASVDALRKDVSSEDLVAGLNELDSELVTVSGTVASAFAAAGTGHVSASFVTLGVAALSPNLKLRLTTAVQDSLDVAQGCSLTTAAPLWRFNAQAQVSAWTDPEVLAIACPAPKVLSATATSSTGVLVTFDRRIDPASVNAGGQQFTLTNGLVASSATVTGKQVQLTTSPQVSSASYQVTVASSVADTHAAGVDAAANSASFTGFLVPAQLVINELNPNLPSSHDLIELRVVSGGTMDKITLVESPSTVVATLPNVVVAAGDLIVVHLAPIAGEVTETTSKSQVQVPTFYDTAWDVVGGTTGLTYGNRVLRVKDPSGTTQDAVPLIVTTGTPASAFPAQLQAAQAEGLWLPTDCGGALCTYTSTPSASTVSVNMTGLTNTTASSVRRISTTDSNTLSDWVSATTGASFGLPNP
nr:MULTISPECIES: chitobiase/beta-hexosaminidase C-terminal domain-containing protein [Myxococcaceae]